MQLRWLYSVSNSTPILHKITVGMFQGQPFVFVNILNIQFQRNLKTSEMQRPGELSPCKIRGSRKDERRSCSCHLGACHYSHHRQLCPPHDHTLSNSGGWQHTQASKKIQAGISGRICRMNKWHIDLCLCCWTGISKRDTGKGIWLLWYAEGKMPTRRVDIS